MPSAKDAAPLVEEMSLETMELPESLADIDDPVKRGPVAMQTGIATRPKWTRATAEAYLRACPKVSVHVPLDHAEVVLQSQQPGKKFVQPVIWNGFAIGVPKGVPCTVPLPIAEILNQRDQPLRTHQARNGANINEIPLGALGITELIQRAPLN